MAQGLVLLAMPIQSIVSYLRILGGEKPDTCRFETPLDFGVFDTPWQEPIGLAYMRFDQAVHHEQIQPLSRDEVIRLPPPQRRLGLQQLRTGGIRLCSQRSRILGYSRW